MDREQIKKIIEDSGWYDETKENGYRAILKEFYSRKMLSTVIHV